MIKLITHPTSTGLVKEANKIGISKSKIIQISKIEDYFYLFYEE